MFDGSYVSARSLAATTSLLAVALLACGNEGESQVIPPVVLALLETAAPTYDDGEVRIYESYLSVPLPLRRPSDAERGKGDANPYPRPPFHLASDTRVTARFILSNLEDKTQTVEVLVNPWNEFVRYAPGVVVGEEKTVPNLSGIDRFVILPPLGRVEGIFTPDDMVELATDLGTAMKIERMPPPADSAFAGPALYNRAFNIQNRSSQPDAVLAPFLPSVVAGVVGFDLGLRTYAPAKVAIEVVLDIEDRSTDRVLPAKDTARRVGRPDTALIPPAAPKR